MDVALMAITENMINKKKMWLLNMVVLNLNYYHFFFVFTKIKYFMNVL